MTRHFSDSSGRGSHNRSARRKQLPQETTDRTGDGLSGNGLNSDVGEALRSFFYEVSAGRKLLVQRVEGVADRPPRLAHRSQQLIPPVEHSTDHLSTESSQVSQQRVDQPHVRDFRSEGAVPGSITKRHSRPRDIAKGNAARKVPSWAWSLAAHVGVLMVLSYFSIASTEPIVDFELFISEASFDDQEMLQALEVEANLEADSLQSDLSAALLDSISDELSDVTGLEDLNELTEVAGNLEGNDWSDQSGLFGAAGSGLTELTRMEDPLAVSFFGTEVEGRRIVFVLDNSGGMRYGQLEALIEELLRSVESLSPKQQFYVIFYSDAVYPLFYPQPAQRFVPPTDRNKQQLRNWLETVEYCMGNEVDKAMAAAESIRPDVVYLLTDGDLDQTRDQRRIGYLLNSANRRFSIHTIGLGVRAGSRAAEKLLQVAEANGGTYRGVEVSEEAKQLAREKNRPYHNEEPGKVWGLGQGKGWRR